VQGKGVVLCEDSIVLVYKNLKFTGLTHDLPFDMTQQFH
jgi:hypothetical protein